MRQCYEHSRRTAYTYCRYHGRDRSQLTFAPVRISGRCAPAHSRDAPFRPALINGISGE